MDDKLNEWSTEVGRRMHQLVQFHELNFEVPVRLTNEYKLNPVELELLNLFEWQETIAIKDVINSLKLPNSTVTSVINRLEKKDILKREISNEDKRTYNLRLTLHGQSIVIYRKDKRKQFYDILFETLETNDERLLALHLLSKITQSINEHGEQLLRRIKMNRSEQEYNEFGPWIIEIRNEEEIPIQFLKEKDVLLQADYCFKIPINAERRKVHAGMLLFDVVVAVYEDHMMILKMDGEVSHRDDIPYEKISYITQINNLLDSQIIVATEDVIHAISYNAISIDDMDKAIAIIRKKVFSFSKQYALDRISEKQSVESILFSNLIHREDAEEQLKIIMYQPSIKLQKRDPNILEKIDGSYAKYILQDSAFLSNGKSLMIINRDKPIKSEGDVDYSYKLTFIKLPAIKEIYIVDQPEMDHLNNLIIKVANHELVYDVGDDFSDEALKDYLML
jgi:DNA-binding MarR family transcriptional regulator